MRYLKSFASSTSGIAAVEFALIAPVMIALLGLLIDFTLAFNTQLQLATATHSAAQYAFSKWQSVDSNSASTLISEVRTVARSSSLAAASFGVNVFVNNAADGSTANNYYCVSPGATPTWSSTGTSVATCSGGVLTSGKFVTISISATRGYYIVPSAIAAKISTLSDMAIVRVQ